MRFGNLLALTLAFAAPAAAQTPSTAAPAVPWTGRTALRLLTDGELPPFRDDFEGAKARADLIRAGRKSLAYLATQADKKVIRLAERDYTSGALAATLEEIISLVQMNLAPDAFEREVRARFDVFISTGIDTTGRVVFSSYYQPVLEASLKRTAAHRHPIYRRPPDMIDADLGDFDKKFAGEIIIARLDKAKRLVPYFDRDAIDGHKRLSGRGLELAWFKEKFDVLDLHIQGSGILRLPSGREMLAGFAATNSRPYNSVGLTLVKAGVFTREEISHDKLRQYFRDHPEAQEWVMAQNPRYTFFKLSPLPKDGEPMGTIQQSLSPARSIAVDPSIIPLGALAFFTTTSPQADREGRLLGQFPNSRFAVCMDTGGAIKGPGRVDIYAGHGAQAATTAKNQWADGRLYILVKKLPPRER